MFREDRPDSFFKKIDRILCCDAGDAACEEQRSAKKQARAGCFPVSHWG
jgi:hypothetical protein